MGKRISKSVRKQLLNIGFLLLLISVTVIVLFTATDIRLHDIGVFLSGCDPWWIVAAFGAMLGFVLFEAASLHVILHRLGERPRFLSSVVYSTSDTYYSAITPSASGGQPASAFYMVKDGIGAGRASFALVFNLSAYTAAIIIIGLFAVIVRPGFFSRIDGGFPKALVIIGFVIQGLLLAFFIGCMFCGGAVRKLGGGIISLLTKMRIVKKPDKWREKLDREISIYKECRRAIAEHPGMTVMGLLFNLAQRVSHVLIPCFVLYAADQTIDFLDLFVCSAFVTIGYNSIPLPGGVGVYEYLYPNIYSIAVQGEAFVLSALMVSRAISYYICMILSGVYTLGYHLFKMKGSGKPSAEPVREPPLGEQTEPCAPQQQNGELYEREQDQSGGKADVQG